MNEQKRDHRQVQAPVQLALNVLAEVDSGKAQAQAKTKTSQPEFVETPSIEAPSTRAPSGESREHALLRDAQAHWQAVDRLTRSLRKRARGPRHRSASAANKHSNAQTSAQRTLWVSAESNDRCESEPYRGTQPGGDAPRAKQNVSSDPGVQICRHLVAALRLQHEQDQLRQASQEAKRSA